jgi:cell wall-associated NlpC family hydrolase
MRIIDKLFILLIILITTLFINSCSTSSYSERYGSTDPNINKIDQQDSTEIMEDDISSIIIRATDEEAKSIIDKLKDVVGTNNKKEDFLLEIVSFLNTPYQYGGENRNGIDCSAFTQKVYGNSLNVYLPRTAREQYKTWQIFDDIDELMFGDLIYFNTSTRYFPGHVGIYLDDNLFAHASSSNGVIVSSLTNDYYSARFVGANRVKINKQK